MFEVSIYIETSMKGPGTRKGWYAAVLEYITKNNAVRTREDFAQAEGLTYHKSVLCAIIKSLKRLNASCFIKIYTDSEFVKNSVQCHLSTWKGNGFMNAQNKPIKNQEEWKELARLLAGHKVEFHIEKRNVYSAWMQNRAKEQFK